MKYLRLKKIYLQASIVFYLVMMLMLIQCQKKQPIETGLPLAKKEVVKLIAELMSLQSSQLPKEKIQTETMRLLQEYKLTPEKYQKIERYYKDHPAEWLAILQQVDQYLASTAQLPPKLTSQPKTP